jgi:hypothetical protein
MKRTTLGLLAPAYLFVASGMVAGCKKEEPPPPLPAAAPVTAAPAPLQLKPMDAGVKPPADAGAPKKGPHGGGGGGHAGGLGACCAALQQNATMAADMTTKTVMIQAAAMCQAMAAQGKDKAAVAGTLNGILRGMGMPAPCR